MAETKNYPKPGLKWGRGVLEANNPRKIQSDLQSKFLYNVPAPSTVKPFSKGEPPKSTNKKITGYEFLKSASQKVIFNDRNNMVLTDSVLNSFFEKVAQMITETVESSSKTQNESTLTGPKAGYWKSNTKSTSVKMPSLNAYMGYRDRAGMMKTTFQSPIPRK